MTGTAKVKPPKDDAEWARNTQRRIEQVEHPSSMRVGAWCVSTEPDTGNLIASNVNGGAVVLANKPTGEGEADAVASEHSAVKVERRSNQSGASYNTVVWDSVAFSTDDWSVTEGSSELNIPSDGVWFIALRVHGPTATTSPYKVSIDIDGVRTVVARQSPGSSQEPTMHVSDTFSLTSGQGISASVWMSGGSALFGASSSDPAAVTSLSIFRVPIG